MITPGGRFIIIETGEGRRPAQTTEEFASLQKSEIAYAGIASFPWNIAIQVVLSLLLGVPATATWALSGSSLRSVMTSPKAVRAFNIVMAVLLLASLYPVFMDA